MSYGRDRGSNNAIRKLLGICFGIDGLLNDRKLIAPQAGRKIALSHATPKTFRHHSKKFVARRVTKCVINRFEAIQVEAKDSNPLPCLL
jgi:hypothetical protein